MIDQRELEHTIFLKEELRTIRINLTLHKLDEFLSGEIHEEMNRRIETKRTKFKVRKFKLMKALEVINMGANHLKERNISSSIIRL